MTGYASFRRAVLPAFAAVALAYFGALACCAVALGGDWRTLGVLLPIEVAVIMLAGKLTR